MIPRLLLIVTISCTSLRAEAPWICHFIDPAAPLQHRSGADGVKMGDVDGDGKLDIVTGWEEGNQIRVCLQPPPSGLKSPWPAFTIGRVKSPEDAVFVDLDGDGQLDVVSATEGRERTVFVHWAPEDRARLGDENAWHTDAFPVTKGKQWWMYAVPLDLDEDGDTDLIVGSKGSNASVSWLKNPGNSVARDLSQWEMVRLADAGWIMSLEVMEIPGGKAILYSDRKGERSGVHLIPLKVQPPCFDSPVPVAASGEEVMFLDIADYDSDGRLDIIASVRPQSIRVYLQPDKAAGPWREVDPPAPVPETTFGSVKAVRYANLDADGKSEFVVTCENATGLKSGVLIGSGGNHWRTISGPEGIKFDRIELRDLDQDGDLDVITCEERTGLGVVWYENPAK